MRRYALYRVPILVISCYQPSGYLNLWFCRQTVRNAADPWTSCSWSTAQSQWVWPTSPWRRTLSSTPSTDWDPLPKTPSQRQVYLHLFMLMWFTNDFRIWLSIDKRKFKNMKRWLPTWYQHSCMCSQAPEWEWFSTATVEPSRPSDSMTPRLIHCLLSRSQTQTHVQTALTGILGCSINCSFVFSCPDAS